MQTQVLDSAGQQLSSVKFGSNLSEGKLIDFQGEQIGQLYELMLESTKPNRQFDIQEDSKWSEGAEGAVIQTTNIPPECLRWRVLLKGRVEAFRNIWLYLSAV